MVEFKASLAKIDTRSLRSIIYWRCPLINTPAVSFEKP